MNIDCLFEQNEGGHGYVYDYDFTFKDK